MNELATVLCVDDDPDTLRISAAALRQAGFDVISLDCATRALDWVERNGVPDAAVLDIRMPEMDGLELARRLRRTADLPVLLLTAVDDESTVVAALDSGVEDYVTKPFSPRVLAARLHRLLRRFEPAGTSGGSWQRIDGRLAVDLAQARVRADGEEAGLTPTESKILHLLLRAAPRTLAAAYLLQRIWPAGDVFEDTLRVHVHRLRHKIEADPAEPAYVVTERGVGYRFAVRGGA